MSESYTVGGDTLESVDHPNWQGQAFVIQEDHLLEYIDLEMRGAMRINHPTIQLFYADINHKPWGDCLSRNQYITEQKCGWLTTGRVRFRMQPFLLERPSKFVIIVSNFPPLGGNEAYWQYDKDDATYRRGIRISSNDGGATWTEHFNDDFMFVEFGNPPLPKPEPPPPISNIAYTKITIGYLEDGIRLILPTSVPCLLSCYISEIPPRKYMTSRITRGLSVPWHVKYSFDAWRRIWQLEWGDSLYHTFDIIPWSSCQTKWITLRGLVDKHRSPSVGPIFEIHMPPTLPLHSFTWGTFSNLTWQANYLTAHNANTDAQAQTNPPRLTVGQSKRTGKYAIWRSALFFDTSTISPTATIIQAFLNFYVSSVYEFLDEIHIVTGEGLTSPFSWTAYHHLLDKTTSFGSIPINLESRYYQIPLNKLGLAAIVKGGTTKLALRSINDINALAPLGEEYLYINRPGSTHPPSLVILIKPP